VHPVLVLLFLQVQYRDGPKSCVFTWQRGRLFDRAAAAMLHELCLEAQEAEVTGVEGARRTKWAPAPLSTLEMQKRGSQVRLCSETPSATAGCGSSPRFQHSLLAAFLQQHIGNIYLLQWCGTHVGGLAD
jgi:hypothetical protein